MRLVVVNHLTHLEQLTRIRFESPRVAFVHARTT